jgi:hypothetical protein
MLQLKWVSQGERTEIHKDEWNCNWVGYSKTGSLCGEFIDAVGSMWSVKIICNSQSKAGFFIGHILQMAPMVTQVQ